MKGFRRIAITFAVVLLMTVFFTVSTYQPVRAAMISTADMQHLNASELSRKKIENLVEMPQVKNQLATWGMTPEQVQGMLDSLTDAEIIDLAQNIDDLPAGGNGVGAVVGAVVLVFLVLLITDILGYTNVFPFVKKTAKIDS